MMPHASILVMGLNHTTAPVAVREQIALNRCTRDDAIAVLASQTQAFSEQVVLATCNRTEIYIVTNDIARGTAALRELFARHSVTAADLSAALYIYQDRAAVEHIFNVACGLDSMIVGEFEILGQVREAKERAAAQRTIGPVLTKLFHHAIHTGKCARSETTIGAGAASVASAAVECARHALGSLKGRNVLVVGAGEMGQRVVKNLRGDAPCAVVVANRTYDTAVELARELGGQAIHFDELPSALVQADAVISATGAPHVIIDAPMVAAAVRGRDGRALCLIDLALPRDVEPTVTRIPNVFVYNIDDLKEQAAANLVARRHAVTAVRETVRAETEAFWCEHLATHAAPVITCLRERAEVIRQAELQIVFNRLSNLSYRERQVIARLSTRIVNKILYAPTAQLRVRAQNGNDQVYFETICDLFRLADVTRGERCVSCMARQSCDEH
jgi:glutamyl-tRNA reductase